MKRLLRWSTTLLVVFFALSLAAQAPPSGQATGSARQTPMNGSGIQAKILFLDTGSDVNGLVISGRATGLDPTQTYFSLLYNVGSIPGGPVACTPAAPPAPQISFAPSVRSKALSGLLRHTKSVLRAG